MRKMILLWLAAAFFLGVSSPGVAFAAQADKVDVCHNGHTINISANALPAHLAHGDTLGACAPPAAVLALVPGTPDPVDVPHPGSVMISVVNVGNAPTGLVVPSVSSGFQIVNENCGIDSPLAPGDSCSMWVATDRTVGSGSAVFTDSLGGSTATVTLSYNGPIQVVV